MNQRRRVSLGALLATVAGSALLAMACAAPAPAPATPAPATTPAAAATPAPATTPAAAAKTEPTAAPKAPAQPTPAPKIPTGPLPFEGRAAGTVTVYTAGPAGLANNLKRDFEAATGATLEVFQGNTGAVLARLDAERARPQADVVILADWSAAVEMAQRGDLMVYVPKGADRVLPQYKDPEGRFIAQGISALGLVYNTTSGLTPREWTDLTTPPYRDRITMPDPAQSGSAYDFVAGLLQNLGNERGWALFQGLRNNQLTVPGTNDAALNPVVAGAKAAVLAGVDYIAYGRIRMGEPIAIVYPESGTVVSPRPIMIMRTAPNPEGAKAFLDFMMSDAGQKLVADALIIPGRADYPVNSARVGLDQIKALPVDYQRSIAQRDEILGRFAREIAR